MASNTLPEPPATLKAIQSYMRIASDIERIDPVVAYWMRLYSTETALKLDKDSPESKQFLAALIVWLENFKTNLKDNETVTNETVGQAHYENFVDALFNKADTLDRNGTANKNTVRMFFMAAVMFDAMAVFGPITDEVAKRSKYAKFKAAYIQKCLKNGETPHPGPIESEDSATGGGVGDVSSASQPPPAPGGFDLPSVPSGAPTSSKDTNSFPQMPETPKRPTDDPFVMTPSQPPAPAPVIPPSPPQITKTPQLPSVPTSQPGQSMHSSYSGPSTISATKYHATNGAPLDAEDLIKGQKYIKFANSALQYDDIPTAVTNLEKALRLLSSGQRSAD